MLGGYFANFSVKHIWKEGNMCAVYVASEDTGRHMRIVWEGDFSQRLLELVMRDIFGFM